MQNPCVSELLRTRSRRGDILFGKATSLSFCAYRLGYRSDEESARTGNDADEERGCVVGFELRAELAPGHSLLRERQDGEAVHHIGAGAESM